MTRWTTSGRGGSLGVLWAEGGGCCEVPGIVEQTLWNWVKADKAGQLLGVKSELVSAERMENNHLRPELARVTMERDILGKATAYFARVQR